MGGRIVNNRKIGNKVVNLVKLTNNLRQVGYNDRSIEIDGVVALKWAYSGTASMLG